MSKPKGLVKLLSKGILPDEFNFELEKSTEFDINDLKFNWFYRDYSFYESKFPQVIKTSQDLKEKKADNKIKTPLEELEEMNINNSPETIGADKMFLDHF